METRGIGEVGLLWPSRFLALLSGRQLVPFCLLIVEDTYMQSPTSYHILYIYIHELDELMKQHANYNTVIMIYIVLNLGILSL